MSDSGGTTKQEQARLRSLAEMAHRIREDRAAGRKRWRGAAQAFRWWAFTRTAWASPKALTMRDEGSGTPSQGADSPARRRFAAAAMAVKAAELDDRERNPEKPAPVERWIASHFGGGRAAAWIADDQPGWSEPEVLARLHRFCRVARDQLARSGWLEQDSGEAG
jgi:hypothetical protein